MPVSKNTAEQRRVNIMGLKGNRDYLEGRDVYFPTHNPTIEEVRAVIKRLSRQRGKKPAEAAQLLTKLLEWM